MHKKAERYIKPEKLLNKKEKSSLDAQKLLEVLPEVQHSEADVHEVEKEIVPSKTEADDESQDNSEVAESGNSAHSENAIREEEGDSAPVRSDTKKPKFTSSMTFNEMLNKKLDSVSVMPEAVAGSASSMSRPRTLTLDANVFKYLKNLNLAKLVSNVDQIEVFFNLIGSESDCW